MDGIFRSKVTGRLYEFVRWAQEDDEPIISIVMAEDVLTKELCRIPYENILPSVLARLREARSDASESRREVLMVSSKNPDQRVNIEAEKQLQRQLQDQVQQNLLDKQ